MSGNRQRTIADVQHDLGYSNGCRNEVIWDLLHEDQGGILKKKIKQLIPDQETGNNSVIQLRNAIFDSVWAQRKYTNKNSLSAIIYVCVTEDAKEVALESTKFSAHPVFRCRKCTRDGNPNSSDCCMSFIDEQGRVYSNWQAYLDGNVLPKGTMVAPRRGIYDFNDNGDVVLEISETPASSVAQQALKVADTGSIVGGLFATAVPIAALLTIPVSAPLMAGAAVVGMATAGYGTLRSGSTLIDRSQHEQSISLADRQARNSWLGVAAGFIGVGAFGATRAMTAAAAAGREISVTTELVVNTMNITTIVLSGTGVANGILDLIFKYQDDEKIELLDVVQLSASLVLFTHSLSNFRLAGKIVNDTRNGTIQDYRKSLSNRQRRMFDKMAKETIRIRGETTGKIDIIRNVNDVPSKQYLNDLYKVNRDMNRQGVRPSFVSGANGAADGTILLNNEVAIKAQIIRSNVEGTLGTVSQPIPASRIDSAPITGTATEVRGSSAATATYNAAMNVANLNELNGPRNLVNVATSGSMILASGVRSLMSATLVVDGFVVKMCEFGAHLFEHIMNVGTFEDVITAIAERWGGGILRFFMNLTALFIETVLNEIETVIGTFIPTESVLHRIILYCVSRCNEMNIADLEIMALEIIAAVKIYFLAFNPNGDNGTAIRCMHCQGNYILSAL